MNPQNQIFPPSELQLLLATLQWRPQAVQSDTAVGDGNAVLGSCFLVDAERTWHHLTRPCLGSMC